MTTLERIGFMQGRLSAMVEGKIQAFPWDEWREEFLVPADCPVQLLRLELANPRRDAVTPGDVAARLDGAVWFDDFRVRRLD